MKYDFETLIQRKNVGSHKWEDMLTRVPDVADDIVPLSVADMELKNAPEITEGLKTYLDRTIPGYTGATDAYYESVMDWMERRHGFRPKKEWFVETAGVVPALFQLISALTSPDDAVLIMTPVYYPFRKAIESNNRRVVENELVPNGSTYTIDFEDFEQKAKLPDVKMLILCSPHNPIGRIWTRSELEQICQICLENEVLVVSDEIHFDLIMPGYAHVSVATLDEQYVNNSIICTAPSKTFNLAGFQTSNIFIPNPVLREKITSARGYFSLNIIGYKACELAYNHCEQWLEQLLVHLDKNKKLVEDFMAQNLPDIKVYELQGTYLQWLDFRALNMDHLELEKFMNEKAFWFVDEGYIFGEGGKGFERINIACPTHVLQKALDRLSSAVHALKAG